MRMESETLDQPKSAEEMRRKAIERLNADFAPQIVQSVEHEGSIEKQAPQNSLGKQPLTVGEKILVGFVALALAGIGTLILANGTYWAHPKYGVPYEMVGDSARLMGVFFLSWALLFFAQIPLRSNRLKYIGITCLLLAVTVMLASLVSLFMLRAHA